MLEVCSDINYLVGDTSDQRSVQFIREAICIYLFSLSFSRSIGLSPCGLATGAILLCFCCMTDWEDGGWAAPCGPAWEPPCCWPGGLWGSCPALVLGGACVICPPEKPELKAWLWGAWEFGTCPGGCLPLGSASNSMDTIKHRDVRSSNSISTFTHLWNAIWESETYLGVSAFEALVSPLLPSLCYLGWVGFWTVVCMPLSEL